MLRPEEGQLWLWSMDLGEAQRLWALESCQLSEVLLPVHRKGQLYLLTEHIDCRCCDRSLMHGCVGSMTGECWRSVRVLCSFMPRPGTAQLMLNPYVAGKICKCQSV